MVLASESQDVIFKELRRPLYRCENPPGLHLMVVESYFDDSSDSKREKYYVCGGLTGNPEQWDAFEILWQLETQELTEPFHSADCESGYEQFKNWPKEKRFNLMARLAGVVRNIGLFGYASIIPITEFRRVYPDLGERDAMRIVLGHVVVNMANLADRMKTDFSIWFERGPTVGIAMDVFSSIEKTGWKPAKRLRGPLFDNKKLRPLQAADLVAREAFKHIDNLGVREPRKLLMRISKRMFFMLWTEGTLKQFAEKGGPGKLNGLWESTDLTEAEKLMHFHWMKK